MSAPKDPVLEKLRHEIDQADQLLLAALAKRAKAVIKIGRHKIKKNLPVVNRSRFSELLAERLRHSTRLSLNPLFIESIFTLIHSESVRIQNEMTKSNKLKRKNSL